MADNELGEVQLAVAAAILDMGVQEVSRRLGLKAESVLRLAVPGGRPHKTTIAYAHANLGRLQLPSEARAQ